MIGALLGLKDVVARNAPVGPGDARRTKQALDRLGFMDGDKFAGNEFPTEGMFAGLKSFQRASGLREDGVMKPGGPTERMLANAGRRVTPLGLDGSVGGSGSNRRSDVVLARRALAAAGHLEPGQVAGDIADIDLSMGIQSFQRDYNLKRDGMITPGGETEWALGRVVEPGRERHDAMTLLQPPIEPGQGREENVNLSASTAAAKEPAEGESGTSNPAEPNAAIKDFDGGGGGRSGALLRTRQRSQGVFGDLNGIAEAGAKQLTGRETAAMREKIERAFPHEQKRQNEMKALLKASQTKGVRDPKAIKDQLNRFAAEQNTPERLRKLDEIDRFHARFNGETLNELNAKRGEARLARDAHAEFLFELAKNREDELKALGAARANGDTARAKTHAGNIAGIDAALPEQARLAAEANQVYAALPRVPHPAIDTRGDGLRESAELAVRGVARNTAGAMAAAGAAGAGIVGKVSPHPVVKSVAKAAGKMLGRAGAGLAFAKSIQDGLAKEIAKSGIDAGDPQAVRKFAEKNKDALRNATNEALIAAIGGKLSKNAATNLSRLIGGNAFVRDGVEAGIEKGIGIVGSEVRKRRKSRNVK